MLLLVLMGCPAPSAETGGKDTGTPPDSERPDVDSDSGDSPEIDTDTGVGETDEHSDSGPDETGDTHEDTGRPTIVCDPGQKWVYVAAGMQQTCGVREDGCAECWGMGEEQAGGGADFYYGYYEEDKPPAGTWSRIEMYGAGGTWDGPLHTCGVSLEEGAVCWGSNAYGQAKVPVPDSIDITVGENVTYGLDTAGEVWGVGDRVELPPPGPYVDIVIGSETAYVRSADGTTLQWPIHNDDPAWVKVHDDKYLQIDAKYYACGVREDGSIRCWYPGDPNNDANSPLSEEVPTGGFDAVCLTEGEDACALDSAGRVVCWGLGYDGAEEPVEATFTQISCGDAHFCGITTEGDLVCWGYDAFGETITPY